MTTKKLLIIIGGALLCAALVAVIAALVLSPGEDTLYESYFDGYETNVTRISESGFIAGWDHEADEPLGIITTVSVEDGEIVAYMHVKEVEGSALIGVYRYFPDGTVEEEFVEIYEDGYVTVTTPTDRGPGLYTVILALGEQIVIEEIEVTEASTP